MGIFWRNSNRELRYGGTASPAGIIGVAVVGTEFWGDLSAKRRANSDLEAAGEEWHLTDTLCVPGCRAGVGMESSSRGTVIVSQVEKKRRQAAPKAGHEGCAWRALLSSKVRGGHRKG